MVSFDGNRGFYDENRDLEATNADLRYQVETLQESFDQVAISMARLRQEDEGWQIIGQVKQQQGDYPREIVQGVAKKAELEVVQNPLLKRAFELRRDPIWSRAFTLEVTDDNEKLQPRFQKKIDDSSVQDTLFTSDAVERNERLCYVSGNLFVAYNKGTGKMLRIPFDEIINRAVDPDDPTRTAYYLRSYTRTLFNGDTENLVEWWPVVEWKADGLDTENEIGKHPVNHDWQIIDMRVNVPTNGHWGLPDVFPALPYAWAYTEYIRDAASVLKALQTIAWRVVGKTKTQAQTAGVQVATARRAGGTAAMTEGTTLDAMPKAGTVNMADGVALAAMVASATGVSTNALISSSTGGTSAAVQSLDGPTVAMARTRQERWVHFYGRVFTAMGITNLAINFPKITEDPIYRTIASLATVRATGALWSDEYRAAVLEAMSISPIHEEAPDVEEYAQAQNALGYLQQNTNASADPLARQGNAGVAGKLGETDNTIRDGDNAAASQTQTDLT